MSIFKRKKKITQEELGKKMAIFVWDHYIDSWQWLGESLDEIVDGGLNVVHDKVAEMFFILATAAFILERFSEKGYNYSEMKKGVFQLLPESFNESFELYREKVQESEEAYQNNSLYHPLEQLSAQVLIDCTYNNTSNLRLEVSGDINPIYTTVIGDIILMTATEWVKELKKHGVDL